MKQIAVMAVLFLVITAIAAAQGAKQKRTPPGNEETAGPLQLSILIDHSEKIPAVLVTVKNVGDDDWILPIGATISGPVSRTHLGNFKILLTTSSGMPATVLYRRIAGIEGRIDPAFTTLVRHSTYTMRLATDDYVVGETNQLLNELAGSGATLQVRYQPNEHNCPKMIDGRNPTMLRCWTNALISNAVTY
jgi:hypothetical protein